MSLCVRRQIWHLRSKWTQPLPQCHAGPGNLRREQLKILKQKPMYISSSIISLSLSLSLCLSTYTYVYILYQAREYAEYICTYVYMYNVFCVVLCVCIVYRYVMYIICNIEIGYTCNTARYTVFRCIHSVSSCLYLTELTVSSETPNVRRSSCRALRSSVQCTGKK